MHYCWLSIMSAVQEIVTHMSELLAAANGDALSQAGAKLQVRELSSCSRECLDLEKTAKVWVPASLLVFAARCTSSAIALSAP